MTTSGATCAAPGFLPQPQGRLPEALDVEEALLAARALVYGLARMAADGHLPEWSPPAEGAAGAASGEDPERRLRRALRLFMGALAPRR